MIRGILKQAGPLLVSIGLVFAVRTVVAEPYRVPSGSMVPTLLVGDELVGSKFPYGFSKFVLPIGELPDFRGRLLNHAPERGDVVVFRLPRDPSITYVKRLIGLPGERIQMRHGRLYINDQQVPRRIVGPYTGSGNPAPSTLYVETLPGGREHEIVEISDSDTFDDTPVFIVPPRHYFMMGDNRDNSLDSRVAAEF
ncbi:MAG: signal peptidase I, partial [Alphaproteobacteria bacterium]|nr:signal peptidase I [Alphaproteobacteria bacterium]